MIQPRWLVFAGGGVRGVSYVGALETLERRGLTRGAIRGYAGVSIGALVALLFALGYSLADARRIVFDLDYSSLQHIDEETIMTVMENCGIDDGAGLRAFIESLLVKRGLKADATFADLKDGAPALRVYACRFRDGILVEFSKRRTPNTPIVNALYASMAVPFYFTPIEIDGELYVDGGISNNYPIDALSPTEQKQAVGFLFKIDDQPFVLGDYTSIINYGVQLVKSMSMNRYRNQMRMFEDRTVVIDCANIHFLDFNMSVDVKEQLIQAGVDAAEKYLVYRPTPPVRRWSIS